MSTATATSLSELVAEAEQLEQDFRQKRGELMSRIRDCANAEAGDFSVGTSTKRRPKAETTSEMDSAVKPTGRRGRPKGSKNKSSSVKPNERNYDNKISLREAIWQVLDQGPEQWAKHLPDLPEDAEGLKVSEIREIIDLTKIWESSSDNISNQVQQHLYKLNKMEKKIARGKDRRYYIVEGAEL